MNKKIFILLLLIIMVPGSLFGQAPKKQISRVSFDFIDADIRNVLRLLTDIAGKNIVISDDVKGKVTMKLDNITWDEALNAVIKSSDLIRVDEENIIRIITLKKFEEEQLKLSKKKEELLKERLERLKQGIDLVSREIRLKYANAEEVRKWIVGETAALSLPVVPTGAQTRPGVPAATPVTGATPGTTVQQRGLLSEYGIVTVVPWNNRVITVKDIKENVEEIERRLKALDVAPEQVQIEARIVDANTDFVRNLGVKWSARFKATISNTTTPVISDKDIAVSPSVTAPVTSAIGTVGVLIGSSADSNYLEAELSAMEKEGTGRIIASPKIITSNNREARINKGYEVPYQTSGMYGTNVEYKKAELELRVVPQVIGDEIKLEISAKKNEPDFAGGTPPPIITREITTKEVIIKDGETVVIGGIYDKTEQVAQTGVPFFRNIPFVGWLFKREEKRDAKAELLIFVTPRIIKNLYREEG
ncbi:MAG: type IV pilus secretin PilQ [Syntrophorhabdaceae bacterium]|nr:type IV pilus secretin PilQ [Syntrophorhabdaceae bacterium]